MTRVLETVGPGHAKEEQQEAAQKAEQERKKSRNRSKRRNRRQEKLATLIRHLGPTEWQGDQSGTTCKVTRNT